MLPSFWTTAMVIKLFQTLKDFDKIDFIKEELEKACLGVVTCTDIVQRWLLDP